MEHGSRNTVHNAYIHKCELQLCHTRRHLSHCWFRLQPTSRFLAHTIYTAVTCPCSSWAVPCPCSSWAVSCPCSSHRWLNPTYSIRWARTEWYNRATQTRVRSLVHTYVPNKLHTYIYSCTFVIKIIFSAVPIIYLFYFALPAHGQL